jgi:hypothetical protein
VYQHAAFVARNLSRYSSANNHLIVELSGLAVAARVLDEPRWHARALTALTREAERQTFADGVNVEMASHYHMFVLEALLVVAWLERAHRAPARRIERVIARMAAYLDAITLRSGAVLHHGDNDDGKLLSLFEHRHAEQLLAAAGALAHDGAAVDEHPDEHPDEAPDEGAPGRANASGDVRPDVAPAGEGARLVCDGAPRPRRAPPAATPSRWFRDGGQIVLRSARLHATFDAGPFGFGTLAAHAHCDALAVSVAFDDRPLVVERGTYRYNGDRSARDRYRATAAHNTVQLGAREQADIAGAFLWSRKPVVTVEHCALAAALDVVRASHDGFAPARHVRTLVRAGDALAVIDQLHGAPAGEPVIARWHLAPDATIVGGLDRADGFVTICDGSSTERRLWFGCDDRPLRARAITTQHSSRYLAQQPACTLELELPAPHARLITLVSADATADLRALRTAALEIAP